MLAAAAALVLHARAYLPFLSDDALISLRYAARLLGGYGLTCTAGPTIEGYSNGLWVLLVALAGAAGAPRYDALVRFRRDSPALGIERRAGRVRVPAHFLNAFPHTAAELLDGRLVASVQAGRPAGVAVPRLRGRWRAEVRSSGPPRRPTGLKQIISWANYSQPGAEAPATATAESTGSALFQ